MKFIRKPIEVEVIKFTGTFTNYNELKKFGGKRIKPKDLGSSGLVSVLIQTNEGDMKAVVGDYVIKGIDENVYPCRSDIFKESYEPSAKLREMQIKEVLKDNIKYNKELGYSEESKL